MYIGRDTGGRAGVRGASKHVDKVSRVEKEVIFNVSHTKEKHFFLQKEAEQEHLPPPTFLISLLSLSLGESSDFVLLCPCPAKSLDLHSFPAEAPCVCWTRQSQGFCLRTVDGDWF
ncbi:hypothetical protein SAY86_003896 [Trapa natans]|uniref:Uncharacterized protein n=1 Tax=Trapa natans TaxID=22666 RepID=A0AAN7RF91_TRANT|nr:hypothetical protein SAY86_003896 [Trapa natans]